MHQGKLFDNGGLTLRLHEGNESQQIFAVQHFQVATLMRTFFFALFFHRMRKAVGHKDFFSVFSGIYAFELLAYADYTPLLACRDICFLFHLPTC